MDVKKKRRNNSKIICTQKTCDKNYNRHGLSCVRVGCVY